MVQEEAVVILALQETLAGYKHYPPQLEGYRAYTFPAQEDFREIAMFISRDLASYEVPHGLCWLVHVKVFDYMGWDGPTHFLNIYLKSGEWHHRARGVALKAVKGIVNKILEHAPEARVVVLGDFNEETDKCLKHLEVGGGQPPCCGTICGF